MSTERERPLPDERGLDQGDHAPPAQPRGDGTPFDTVLADVIPALAARLRASGLGELEVRTTDWRVRVRRDAAPAAQPVAMAANPAVHVRGAAAASGLGADGSGVARSPAVGYFQPAPAAEVGRSVRSGDLLGHVDMLGIHHDVAAPTDGVVIRSVAAPGEAVEFGQPLVLVESGAGILATLEHGAD